jgi:hypothetical protein
LADRTPVVPADDHPACAGHRSCHEALLTGHCGVRRRSSGKRRRDLAASDRRFEHAASDRSATELELPSARQKALLGCSGDPHQPPGAPDCQATRGLTLPWRLWRQITSPRERPEQLQRR